MDSKNIDLEKSMITNYDWTRFIMSLLIAFMFIYYIPNKIIAILVFISILIIGLYDSFCSAHLTSEEVTFYRIFQGKKKYSWQNIKKVVRRVGVRQSSYYKVETKDRKFFYFYTNDEIDDFFNAICLNKGINLIIY